MAEMPWFRFYSEAINDTKFRRIARNLQSDPLTVIGAWVVLLSLASKSSVRGHLLVTADIPYTKDDIADALGWHIQDSEMLITEFIDLGMMEIEGNTLIISNWKKRQYESDNSTKRVQKHREMKRSCNVPETPPDTESDTDTELKEKEEKAAEIYKFYENNFTQLTGYLRDEVGDAIDTYPHEWIMDAMQRAIKRNARNWAYVLTILKDWKANGFQNKDKTKHPAYIDPRNQPTEEYF